MNTLYALFLVFLGTDGSVLPSGNVMIFPTKEECLATGHDYLNYEQGREASSSPGTKVLGFCQPVQIAKSKGT